MFTRGNLAAVMTGIVAGPGAIIINSILHIRSGSAAALMLAVLVGIVTAIVCIRGTSKEKKTEDAKQEHM